MTPPFHVRRRSSADDKHSVSVIPKNQNAPPRVAGTRATTLVSDGGRPRRELLVLIEGGRAGNSWFSWRPGHEGNSSSVEECQDGNSDDALLLGGRAAQLLGARGRRRLDAWTASSFTAAHHTATPHAPLLQGARSDHVSLLRARQNRPKRPLFLHRGRGSGGGGRVTSAWRCISQAETSSVASDPGGAPPCPSSWSARRAPLSYLRRSTCQQGARRTFCSKSPLSHGN